MEQRIRELSDTEKKLVELNRRVKWVPMHGPQLRAYRTTADETLYGGAAGGGKTDLALGLAISKHRRTLFLRREGLQLQPAKDRLAEIMRTRDGLNNQTGVWRMPNGRQVQFGGCPTVGDEQKFQGNPRDLLVCDEAAQFEESQIDYLVAWSRTTVKGLKCRVLFCSNPPLTSEGLWLLERFSPWFLNSDPRYPAEPGEIIKMENGITRTFIPSLLGDNIYLRDSGYRERLEGLPEHLREALLKGNFLAVKADQDYQAIPSEWTRAAMNRPHISVGDQITAIGVDPSRGGADSTIIAVRRDWVFDKLIEVTGKETSDGGKVAAKVMEVLGNSIAPVYVDTIGIGASVYDHLRAIIGSQAISVNGSARADEKQTDLNSGELKFTNWRAMSWWRARDLLSPESPVKVSLPNDRKLLGELSAPTYKLTSRGIQIEGKPEIIKRLGRSTDRADAVVYAMTRSLGYSKELNQVGRFRAI